MLDTNEEVVRRFANEVLNKGDYSVMRELVHTDYVYRSPHQELHGPEALEGLLTAYRTGLPDMTTSIDELIVSGEKIAISIALTGTHLGDLMGIPATGNQVNVRGMVISRLKDGKIIEEWEILDVLGMFQQLGVVSLRF